jgi:hypothetical protein
VEGQLVVVVGGLMLRETDVPLMMLRVESALTRAQRDGNLDSPIFVHSEGDADFGIAPLRGPATLTTEFFSGSGRPVIGPVVRFGKRIVRRSLRWYIAPVAEQQSRVNHALLDLVERLRVQNERLALELEVLRGRYEAEADPQGGND